MRKLKPMDERTWVSASEAAKLADCTTRHIQNLVNEGKLSATRNEVGYYQIERCELFRVFPDAHDREQKRIEERKMKDVARTLLEQEIEHLKSLMSEKDKLNEFLKQQLELKDTEKLKILDTLNSNQRLLEHQSEKPKRKWFGKS